MRTFSMKIINVLRTLFIFSFLIMFVIWQLDERYGYGPWELYGTWADFLSFLVTFFLFCLCAIDVCMRFIVFLEYVLFEDVDDDD
jgi:hypothetical protein